MKTIYSLKEFKEKVMEIAETVNEQYATVKVEIGILDEVKFTCYINGYDIHHGDTMEEALAKMQQQVHPIVKDIDVEIELELETIN